MKKIEIKKILVPVDFTETSETATTNAIALAKLFKAEICLIHVTEFYMFNNSVFPETMTILPSLTELENIVKTKMNELKENIKRNFDILPEVYITAGEIHSEIISFSEKNNIDLIMMGTHGALGYNDIFMGTNSQRVVTLSEVPVLTMQKTIDKPVFKNILIPIDNSLHSREKVNLAMIIADLFGAEIHIIGLPNSNDEHELNMFKTKCDSVEKIVESHKLAFKTTILQGENLAEAALGYATKNNCDLIVINTGHESKFTGIFLGGFAQQIVNHSKIPVLSFKHTEDHLSIETPGYGIS